MVESKRGRGRPKGSRSSPRAVLWVCSDVIDSELVSEQVQATTKAEAEEAFSDKYGNDPSISLGPFYLAVGKLNSSISGVTVDVDVGELKFGKERKASVFNGWNGFSFDLENRKDAVYFMPSEPVDSSSNKKRKPMPRVVLKSAVQFK